MKYGLSAEIVASMQAVFAKHPKIEKVILYGSRAKGTQHEGSDIDLTLVGELELTDLYAVDEELDKLNLPYMIDLSLYGQIDNVGLVGHIERWGEVFYQKNTVWKIKKLGDVCSLDKLKFKGSNLPYVGLEDIEGHTGVFLGSLEPKEVASSTFKFTNKHVLYGRLRPYLNKALIPEFEGHCSSEIFPVLPNSSVNRGFLYYWLTSSEIVKAIEKTCTGARMPRANVNEILTFDFPLPRINEQKRIVAILDLAFADIEKARANAEQNLKNARELFESYLQQVFSQRGDGWIESSMSDKTLLQMIDGDRGKNYPKKADFSNEGYCLFLSTKNVRPDGFKFNEKVFITEERDNFLRKGKLEKNDVIITTRGTIGNLAIFDNSVNYENIRINSGMLILRPNIQKILPSYLFEIMRSGIVKKQIQDKTSGAAHRAIGFKFIVN